MECKFEAILPIKRRLDSGEYCDENFLRPVRSNNTSSVYKQPVK